MRQISLLPGGIFRSGNDVLHADKKRLFYRSTMAVYVINRGSHTIEKILCVTDRSVICVAYSPHDENAMVMFGADGGLTLWSIAEEKVLNRCVLHKMPYMRMEWDPVNPLSVIVVTCQFSLRVQRWDVHRQASEMQELYCFSDKSIVPSIARVSPGAINKLAVACLGGRVYCFDLGASRSYSKLHDKSFPSTITINDMQWDKLSAQYLLVAYDVFLCLWDATSSTQIQLFERQNAAVSSIAWLEWAAGSFVSANPKTGILKIWNASQKVPLESIRVISSGGIQSIFAVPLSSHVLLACLDGSFHVYDVARKHSLYKTSTSHSETIFNCAFCPTSFNQFASCSYDGTVRIWKLSDMSLVQYLHAGDGIIYSVSWSPNGKMVAGSTILGTIIIWDAISSKEIARFKHHTKASFCVSWNTILDRMLVSTSSDGNAFVFELEETLIEEANAEVTGSGNFKKKVTRPPILIRFAHPAPVYGCAWSPFKSRSFCTGCQDSLIRVFDFSVSGSALYTLTGHSARVFNCIWSPLVSGLLASGSDDLAVQVWDTNVSTPGNTGANVLPKKTLRGHIANVRALSWNYEHKSILLSGSWDRSIRVWDVMNGICLKIVCDHAADVYALVSHPQRPFSYISCSRDSTVRLWVLDTIASHLKALALVDESFSRIRDDNEEVISSPNSPSKNSGGFRGGRNLHVAVKEDFSDVAVLPPSPKRPGTIAPSASPPEISDEAQRKTPSLPDIASKKSSVFHIPVFGLSCSDPKNPSAFERNQCNIEQVCTAVDAATAIQLPQLMHGKESGLIQLKLNRIDKLSSGFKDESEWEPSLRRAEKFYNIFSLFSGSLHAMDLWEAAISVLAQNVARDNGSVPNLVEILLRPKSDMTVTLESDIINKSRSDARKLESVRVVRKGVLSNKIIEKLREAAMINIRLGDFERYCNIMIDLGDWAAALAIAPKVSMQFWEDICKKYADYQLEQGNEECIPYLIASGRGQDAANFYISRGDSKSGVLVAKSSEAYACSTYEAVQCERSSSGLLQRVSRTVAEKELQAGNVVLGAAQLIACSGDYELAIEQLMSCFEFELAYALGCCFRVDVKSIAYPLIYKCASEGQLSVALELLLKFDHSNEASSLLISAYSKTDDHANLFIHTHKLTRLEDWAGRVKGVGSKDLADSIEDDICCLVCARNFSQAAYLAINYLKRRIRVSFDSSSKTKSVVHYLKHMQLMDLDGTSRIAIISCLFWFCSFDACNQGYYEIAWNLLRILGQSNFSTLGLTSCDILLQDFLFRLAGGDRNVLTSLRSLLQNIHLSNQCLDYLRLIEINLNNYEETNTRVSDENIESVGTNQIWGEVTSAVFREAQKLSDVLSLPSFWSYTQGASARRFKGVAEGSTLPSANVSSSSLCSYITQTQIVGIPVVLEDGITVISLNEAFSWVQWGRGCYKLHRSAKLRGEYIVGAVSLLSESF